MRAKPRIWQQFCSWFKSVNQIYYPAHARSVNDRRSRRLHGYGQLQRALAVQSLEPRQLMASDLSVTDFATNGTNLLVSYDIAAETAPQFDLSIYRTSHEKGSEVF